MRVRFLFIASAILFAASCWASTTYRFAAAIDDGVYLLSANGKSKLRLAMELGNTMCTSLTVSPSGKGLVADCWVTDDHPRPYWISLETGEVYDLSGALGFLSIPDTPLWLSDHVVVLERWDEQEMEGGTYAVDVRNGVARRVVPPNDSDFSYGEVFTSPSKKLIATNLGITMGSWLSVCELATGKLYWRTNPEQGFGGMTGVTWFSDSKSLLVSFSRDEYSPNTTGIWKYDALTGKSKLWKYPGRNIDGIWASPDYRMLAVGRGDTIEFIRLPDGKLLFSTKVKQPHAWDSGAFFNARWFLFCGDEDAYFTVVDLRTRRARVYNTGMRNATFSPDGASVLYTPQIPTPGARTIDLRIGKITRIPSAYETISWLPHDIVR